MSAKKVSDAEDVLERLTAAMREGRGMLKDIEQAQKRADTALALGRQVVETLEEVALTHVDGIIAECVATALQHLGETTDEELKKAVAGVHDHFNKLSDLLMGKSPDSVGPDVEKIVDNLASESTRRNIAVRDLINEKLDNFRKITGGL